MIDEDESGKFPESPFEKLTKTSAKYEWKPYPWKYAIVGFIAMTILTFIAVILNPWALVFFVSFMPFVAVLFPLIGALIGSTNLPIGKYSPMRSRQAAVGLGIAIFFWVVGGIFFLLPALFDRPY